jgi:hypothetical protein
MTGALRGAHGLRLSAPAHKEETMSSHSVVGRSRVACRGTLIRLTIAMTAAVCVGLPAAPALAATIGQTGSSAGANCAQGVVADTSYVVPSGGGTITSFSFESVAANAGQQLDFLVLRPTGGSDYTVIGKTGLQTLAGTGAVETFAASIPVQSGDILGFWLSAEGVLRCARFATNGTVIFGPNSAPDPSVGDTVSLPFHNQSAALNLSANLVPVTSKAQCKKGGWKTFGVFKNQGDCVAFVATKGKNPPSG